MTTRRDQDLSEGPPRGHLEWLDHIHPGMLGAGDGSVYDCVRDAAWDRVETMLDGLDPAPRT